MDGFNQTDSADQYAFTQFRKDQISAYWAWAKRYAIADNFFASAVGPSFPNHMFSIAATSGGALDNPWQPPSNLAEMQQQGYAKSWGCDIARDGYVEVIDPEGYMVKVSPCFDFKTEGDLLNAKHIPWSYYAATNAQLGYIWSAYSAIDRYRNNATLWSKHIRPVDDVIRDIDADRLPPVSWITPRFQLSQHPEYNFCWGQNWTIQVMNALMALGRLEGHARRDDVGRLRRVLRPRAAGAARRHRARHQGARDDHQPVRALGLRRPHDV